MPSQSGGMRHERRIVSVHLAAGIGNIVLATPLLVLLARTGFVVDLRIDGDYIGIGDLLQNWGALRRISDGGSEGSVAADVDVVIPAIPPFYWPAFRQRFAGESRCLARPPDDLFYEDEQRFYLAFASSLGCDIDPPPSCFLPVAAGDIPGVTAATVVLAPGCKTGEMAAKRWPCFTQLAQGLPDVVVIGTADDLHGYGGEPLVFPGHVRSFVDRLTLRQTAELIAASGLVVANDSGLGHVAAALGVPTLMIFGPTPNQSLGRLPPNVLILRSGVSCQPCWFSGRFQACRGRIDCLAQLGVTEVLSQIHRVLHQQAWSSSEPENRHSPAVLDLIS